MFTHFRPALVMLLGFTLLTGIVYPALVTTLAEGLWPQQANGSILTHDGKSLGSRLIGQGFTDPKYFWSRPSAATPAYNGTGGSGSNLAQSNPALAGAIAARRKALEEAHGKDKPIPVDLLTASASGLDPHISPAAADYQLARVARARGLEEAAVRQLVQRYTESRDLGVLGEPRVNVLKLNLALDGRLPPAGQGLTRWGASDDSVGR